MIKTLRISFSLKNTYRVNGILYAIKQLPLLKKVIPATVYQIRGFKIFANILSGIWEVISAFLGKLVYFLVMILAPAGLLGFTAETQAGAQVVLHLLLCLTFVGGFLNDYMFDPTRDKYYAMFALGMNAREYTLVNYSYTLLKVLLGFGLFSFLFGLYMGLAVWQCVLVPFFVAGVKLFMAARKLRNYERRGTMEGSSKLGTAARIAALVLLLAAAYGLSAAGLLLPEWASVSIMGLFVVLGALSVRKIVTFRHYRAVYQELLADITFQMDSSAQTKLQAEQSRKSISADASIHSKKKGFEYLNELFIKRHQKILWRAAKRIAWAALIVTAAVLLLFVLIPESREAVNHMLMTFLPYFVFIMYLINRGTGFTRALFINCDHCLLTYSFYKQPKLILKLFQIRLREIIKVNLLPAAVIGGGLAVLLLVSGGTDNPLNYAVLFVSVVCLSIFFSVHYLTLYYLLQPYNAGTEIKSGAYQFIMWATYFVCYVMMQFHLPTLIFGLMTILFCVLYCIVASILVYKLAPKTFRLRT